MSNWNLPPKGGYMEAPKKMYYQTMTKLDVEERLKKDDVIIIPVGSTENHGAAGPIGEDTFMVTRIAEMVAEKTAAQWLSPSGMDRIPSTISGSPARFLCRTVSSLICFAPLSPAFGIPASASRFLSASTGRSILSP